MKTFRMYDEDFQMLIVGNDTELKPIYKSMCRDNTTQNGFFTTFHGDFPIFKPGKMYGLMINMESGIFHVMDASEVVQALLDYKLTR